MKWAYGITTVIERTSTTLPKTIRSLEDAGFNNPPIFVDGTDIPLFENVPDRISRTIRTPRIGAYGNWILTLWELFIRNPQADRFAMFQDDFVTYKNLRKYLENCQLPDKSYWNLITHAPIPEKAPRQIAPPDEIGWFKSNQWGRGAVALIFSKDAVVSILSSKQAVNKPMAAKKHDRNIDGMVSDTLQELGYTEYIHNPSLVNHIGDVSTLGHPSYHPIPTFKGESFDAMSLLEMKKVVNV